MFHEDYLDFLFELNKNGVAYLVVGGRAVNLYGYPRYTGDLDILVKRDHDNAQKTMMAIVTNLFS